LPFVQVKWKEQSSLLAHVCPAPAALQVWLVESQAKPIWQANSVIAPGVAQAYPTLG
jgi:hypothetical protein